MTANLSRIARTHAALTRAHRHRAVSLQRLYLVEAFLDPLLKIFFRDIFTKAHEILLFS